MSTGDRHVFVVRTQDNAGNPVDGVFDDLQAGRATIGWSWEDRLDLRTLAKKPRADMDRHESDAWRCHGFCYRVRVDDYLLYPNQPQRGRFVAARVTGDYDYLPGERDFRSYRPCELLTPRPVSLYDPIVPSQLKHRLGRQRRFSRVWDPRPVFDFLHHIADAGKRQDEPGKVSAIRWDRIHKERRATVADALHREFSRHDLSRRFSAELFERMGYTFDVQEGPSEHGSDVVIAVTDSLLPAGVEFRIGVQVFAFRGNVGANDLQDKLCQLLDGWDENQLDYGALLTTGHPDKPAQELLLRHNADRPDRKVRLIDGNDLADLFVQYFPPDS